MLLKGLLILVRSWNVQYIINNVFISYNSLVLEDKLSTVEEFSIEQLFLNIINRASV